MPAGNAAAGGEQPGGAGECLADFGGDGVRGGLGECGERAEQMAGCSEECGDAEVGEDLRGAAAGAPLGEAVVLLACATEAGGEEGEDEEGDERVEAWGLPEVEGCGGGLREEEADRCAHGGGGRSGGAEAPGEQAEGEAEQQGSQGEVLRLERRAGSPEGREHDGTADENGESGALGTIARRCNGLVPCLCGWVWIAVAGRGHGLGRRSSVHH